MTDRPKELDDYLQVCKELAALDARKKELRPVVLPLLEQWDGEEDIYTTESTKTTYHDDLISAWVMKEYPTVDVFKETLDWEKFRSHLNLGNIDITKMPKECITEVTITNINTARKRSHDT